MVKTSAWLTWSRFWTKPTASTTGQLRRERVQCAGCGASMRLEDDKEYLICDYCGSVYCPDPNEMGIRVLGEPTGLTCSLCAIPMVHAAIGGQRVSYCGQCQGILVGMDLFSTLI